MAEETQNPEPQTSDDVSNDFDLMSHVPDEYKGDEYKSYWEKTKDLPTLVKNAVHADKMVGSRVSIPTEESTQEDWDSFYNKLGRPESPDKYELDMPEGADENFAKWYKDQAHKHGLSATKAKEFMNEYLQFVNDNYTQSQEQIDAAYANRNIELTRELRKPTEWGPNYDRNMGLTKRLLQTQLPEETQEMLDKSELAYDKGFTKWLGQVANLYAEANLISGDAPKGVTQDDAIKKIQDIESNPATFDSSAPDHQALKRQRHELYQIAYSS